MLRNKQKLSTDMRSVRAVDLLLSLHLGLADAVCGAGWQRHGSSCYIATSSYSSHSGCSALCGENATLACITSAEEHAFVMELVQASGSVFTGRGCGIWVGNFQWPFDQGASVGWEWCTNGERSGAIGTGAANSSSWSVRNDPLWDSSLDDARGVYMDCAALKGPCASTRRGPYRNRRCHDVLACLCERPVTGVATEASAYLQVAPSLSRFRYHPRVWQRTYFASSFMIVLILLPCCLVPLRTCRRQIAMCSFGACKIARAIREPARRVEGIAQVELQVMATSTNCGASSAELESQRESVLMQAARTAAARRLRVTLGSFSLGWTCLVIAVFPWIFEIASPIPNWPGNTMILICGSPAPVLMLIALMPTDERAISIGCAVLFVTLFLVSIAVALKLYFELVQPLRGLRPGAIILFALLCIGTTLSSMGMAAALPLRRCGADMPPRQKLLRLWLVVRTTLVFTGLALLAHVLVQLILFPTRGDFYFLGPGGHVTTIAGFLFLLFGATPTYTVRGHFIRLVGGIGDVQHEHLRAAAVGALLGGCKPAFAIARAKANFRAIPLAAIDDDTMTLQCDLVTQPSRHDISSRARLGDPRDKHAQLRSMTRTLALDDCDAFISHSWSDVYGPAKLQALQEWAGDRPLDHLWVWLDIACISTNAFATQDDLVCLPIWLSGCRELLVLAGATCKFSPARTCTCHMHMHMHTHMPHAHATSCSHCYPRARAVTQRLWCIMEMYIFHQMGGTPERVVVKMLEGRALDISTFDVAHAQCAVPHDREKLLAVIETGLGSLEPFNRVMKTLLVSRAGASAPDTNDRTRSESESRHAQ